MKKVIVLAMHGSPPRDFPPQELAEFFRLHAQAEAAHRHPTEGRYAELEKKMREWPRTAENDPFHAASQELAAALGQAAGCQVLTGFNEFCSPSLEQALQTAAGSGAEKVFIATPMMTRGGQHAEREIPAIIETFRLAYPKVQFVYAWPFATSRVAAFLAGHIAEFE